MSLSMLQHPLRESVKGRLSNKHLNHIRACLQRDEASEVPHDTLSESIAFQFYDWDDKKSNLHEESTSDTCE